MHLHFEKNNNAKCDCNILSLSWMGKVPDESPEDEGWQLDRINYYQEGWLATGNARGLVGVTFTTSHCRTRAAELPLRANYNLRGHRSEIMIYCREYKKADTYLVKAIQKDPDNAFIHVQRAMLQLEWKNDIDKAVELLNKALELDEKCDVAYEALGYIATKRENLEEAIRLFDKALVLCRTSRELTHIYYLREDAKLQLKVKNQSDIINIIGLFSRFIIDSLFSSE